MSVVIVADDPAFDGAMERVLNAAFGPGRFAKVSERVREFASLERTLSRVALRDGAPVGCCRIYRVAVAAAPMLFLGPLAVAPEAQGDKLGAALVAAALAACDASGARGVIVVGQPRMFAPFGFVEIPPGRIRLPGPVEARRLQWRPVGAGDLSNLSGALTAPPAAS